MGEFTVSTHQFDAAVKRLLSEYTDIRHKCMMDASQKMVDEARLRTPIDKGNLTGDITGGTEINEKSETAVVYVPVNAPSSKYAIPMHEHDYNLGKGSLAKQAKNGGIAVGKGYLTRAITDNIEEIMNLIRHTLMLGLKNLTP